MINKSRRHSVLIGLFGSALLLSATVAYGQSRIVGMSIACSNDRVYTWYENGNVTVGPSANLGAYQSSRPYSLPPGKSPYAIVGIGIARNDHVYAWYLDGTVSSGTSTDLGRYRAPYRYTPKRGSPTTSIVGMDIACSNDRVYVWYSDGFISSGTSDDIGKDGLLRNYSLAPGKRRSDLVGIGIAKNDHVYAWYRDGTVSSGTSVDLDQYRPLYSYVYPIFPCDIYARPPEIELSTKSVVSIVSRGPSCATNANMTVYVKNFVGSIAKHYNILATKNVNLTNGEVKVVGEYRCGDLFVEVESGGRKVRSEWVRNHCQ